MVRRHEYGDMRQGVCFAMAILPSQNGWLALRQYTDNSNPLRHIAPSIPFRAVWSISWPFVLAGALVLITLIVVLTRARIVGHIRRPRTQTRELVFLELTFPSDTAKSAFATQQLYSLLQADADGPTLGHASTSMAGKRYSLELYATRRDGIKYVLAVPPEEALGIELNLTSYLPGLTLSRVDDYLPLHISPVCITSLSLSSDIVVPLKGQGEQGLHDPIAFIAGQMTHLSDIDLVAYQLVVSPITKESHPRVTKRLDLFRERISTGLPLSPVLTKPGLTLPSWLLTLLTVLERALTSVEFVISILRKPPTAKTRSEEKGAGELSRYEQKLSDSVQTKIDAPLFETSIRVLASVPGDQPTPRTHALLTTFRLFTSAYQSLVQIGSHKVVPHDELAATSFAQRIHAASSARTVLGAPELTDLYHFPNTAGLRTEGLSGSRSFELPLPTSALNAMTDGDGLIGTSVYGGRKQAIRLSEELRLRHTYIIGRTGTGKTTLITRAVYEDILAGRGVAVLDPHGDMFQHLLGLIPRERMKDVIVFDPAEREWPIGINILNPDIPFKDDIERRDRIASAVVAVFQKLADEKYWGPRMPHILKNATLTALYTPDPSLYTLQRLLTDRKYQKEVASSLKDPVLKQFWDKELARAGDYQLTSYTAPLTYRLGQFITSGMGRHILLQKHSTISMSRIMDEGKILLVNLSKGDLGEDQSTFFGTIITSLIWMAAYSRTRLPERERRNFFIYVDEFQNFATHHYEEIASEGRKFHLGLALSHQSVAQIQDTRTLHVIAANAGTIISFAASPYDEQFVRPFMAPVVKEGDIMNLPAHHFFVKSKDIPSADTFSGVTSPLPASPDSAAKAQVLRQLSRLNYGTNLGLLDAYFGTIFDPEKSERGTRGQSPQSSSHPPSPQAQSTPAPSPPSVQTKPDGAAKGPPKAPSKGSQYAFRETLKMWSPATTKNKQNRG